jgi:hypothetical protein
VNFRRLTKYLLEKHVVFGMCDVFVVITNVTSGSSRAVEIIRVVTERMKDFVDRCYLNASMSRLKIL